MFEKKKQAEAELISTGSERKHTEKKTTTLLLERRKKGKNERRGKCSGAFAVIHLCGQRVVEDSGKVRVHGDTRAATLLTLTTIDRLQGTAAVASDADRAARSAVVGGKVSPE